MVGAVDTTWSMLIDTADHDYVRALPMSSRAARFKSCSPSGVSPTLSASRQEAILSGRRRRRRHARVAEDAGFKSAIGFDMGGTSTDVFTLEGELERVYETRSRAFEFERR